MKRYAFIDVSNTKASARDALGFSIDWEALFKLLTGDKWGCKKVFYYEGSMAGTKKYDSRTKKLEKIGYILKTKEIFMHKNKEKIAKFICNKCTKENSLPFNDAKFHCEGCQELNINSGVETLRHPKANFDVELTIDTLEHAESDTEFLLFTGDGDFCALAEKLMEKGSLVTFVSTAKQGSDSSWRFSTRLKKLIAEEEHRAKISGAKTRIRLLELDNWKNIIKKTPRSATFPTDKAIIIPAK